MDLEWLESLNDYVWSDAAKKFCADFCSDGAQQRFVFGRNIYTKSLIDTFDIDGVIDDFCLDEFYEGVPIIRAEEIPSGALVINAVGGRVLTAQKRLAELGVRNLDFFAFSVMANKPLPEIRFNEGFVADFLSHTSRYLEVYHALADAESKAVFQKVIQFRVTKDIQYLSGFKSREERQYFEDFLNLKPAGEVFVDVGGYDGFTTQEFIQRCPEYSAIYLFEPDAANMQKCRERLKSTQRIYFNQCGLSDFVGELRSDSAGSETKLGNAGCWVVEVKCLDSFSTEIPSFIKIDVEGSEKEVLLGARDVITKYHPRIAVAIYHCAGDFWKIPALIQSFGVQYRIYIRHYTESIYETVMFFVPEASAQTLS
ncbi:FkbM family methyltransferase [Chitinibacter sp. ZOR0017]|uniref:FkbM family methyltransferase n=1 Tax=Chitinibacter sp. ZOR0017 TaxID=1339254 RepID=UPI00064706B6|nr:FkbM family methyltransferase [Chitinibacter sp. ZOR0017]